jgi:hypothetical protein
MGIGNVGVKNASQLRRLAADGGTGENHSKRQEVIMDFDKYNLFAGNGDRHYAVLAQSRRNGYYFIIQKISAGKRPQMSASPDPPTGPSQLSGPESRSSDLKSS